MRPILFLLVPIGEGLYPDNSLPGGQGGYPSQPIYMPPYPSQGPGFPTHPIAPGGSQPYPDHGLPGNQPYPDHGLPGRPVYPSQPIYYPPYPSQGPGFPTHPIAPGGPYPDHGLPIPPEPTEPPTVEEGGKWVWTPIYGWLWKPEARPK